jgi:hypothetical protein
MFNRYRTALMEGADPQQPTVPVAAPAPTQPPAPPAPAAGEEWKNMTAEQFKARLGEATAAGEAKLLKALGVKDPGEIKSALAEFKKLQDAQLSEQERSKKQIDELAPKAQRAEKLEQAVKTLLETEEKLIPDDKKGLLDLAPSADQPEARLTWIANAKAKGLFGTAAAVTTTIEPTPKPAANPATTMAPNGPTPPSPAGGKSAFEKHQDMVKAGKDILAARFYQDNRKAIEASRPKP